jgi:hypothetical protein
MKKIYKTEKIEFKTNDVLIMDNKQKIKTWVNIILRLCKEYSRHVTFVLYRYLTHYVTFTQNFHWYSTRPVLTNEKGRLRL